MTGGPEIGVWANGRLGQELGTGNGKGASSVVQEYRPQLAMTKIGWKNWVGEGKSASRFVRRPQRRIDARGVQLEAVRGEWRRFFRMSSRPASGEED